MPNSEQQLQSWCVWCPLLFSIVHSAVLAGYLGAALSLALLYKAALPVSLCSVLQELSQWRQQKLQESLRNSVLDEEAAAKFSTAAALAAKEKRKEMAKTNYDKGLLTAVDVDKFVEVRQGAAYCY